MITEEINLLLSELKNLSTTSLEPIDSEDRAVYLGINKPRVRDIGQRLHELGGHHLMVSVWREIPKHDQLELTYAWHGIGIWEV